MLAASIYAALNTLTVCCAVCLLFGHWQTENPFSFNRWLNMNVAHINYVKCIRFREIILNVHSIIFDVLQFIHGWIVRESFLRCVGTNKSIGRSSNVNDVLHFTIYWNLCVWACAWFCAIHVFNKRINLNWDGHVAWMTTIKHFDNTKYKWFYTWFYSFMSGVVVMLKKTHKFAQKH